MKIKATFAFWLIGIGGFVLITLIFLFVWRDNSLLVTSEQVNHSKFSSLGSIISGLVGIFWSLAGVILFYVALTEQRKDMETNRAALNLQTKALTQQIKEFEIQTKELEATRKVYVEQSSTQQLQRFEATFFQMLSLHHNIVDSMTLRNSIGNVSRTGRDSFRTSLAIGHN